ncbi:MAG: domain containing protein [Pseudonocardia sp.]|jgi:CHAD domain-containing protein|uniref:CYTH and CHAD domain-containing protein n=1 Tax=Pseudonocardia sp. TaxID=60912 RepID=UPI0026100DA5|nr:CHAD domain-containing protein [Pseudonocardia sp.]MCU1625193.1 domain containing protein [Pseudonocardia sp.]
MSRRTDPTTQTATDPTETHVGTTYRGPAAAGAPRLADLDGVRPGRASAGEVREIERYDTADLRLATQGIVLAVRREDDAEYWRLDLPDAGEGERLQVSVTPSEVEGVDPELPAELDELVRGARRGAEVRPVGRIRRVRTRTPLRAARRPVGELVRDEVQVATLGSSTTLENWSEAEVRLTLSAPAGLAEKLAARLAETGMVPAASGAEAELDRLLRVEAPAPPRRRIGKKGSAGAVVLGYVAEQVDALTEADLLAHRGDDEGVHRMRVAARRLRSTLQNFPTVLDRERTRPLIDELRRLGQQLAPARDLKVVEERITAAVAETDDALVLGPVRARVTKHFARPREEARAAVLTELDGDRYAALRSALERLLQDPPLTGAATRPARKELPVLENKAQRRFDKRLDAALDALATGDAEAGDAAVHEARKAGKRLRYAAEVTRAPGMKLGRKDRKKAKAHAKQLKSVHKALGEHQDTVVSRRTLRELGAAAHAAGENGFTFGLLHGRDQAIAERIEETLPQMRH